ncbi:phenylacetate-CoA ligase [Sporosarcina luteola]|nr:phenylacetate-CoA ligase [Sporosarcina luteola]
MGVEVRSDREIDVGVLLERVQQAPFYKKKLESVSPEVPFKGLPFTTKDELRSLSMFDLLAVERRRISHFHESSGTTGIPSASWYTKRDLEIGGRDIGESGIQFTADDLVLIRFPFSLFLPAYLVLHAAYQSDAGVIPVSSRNTVTTYPKVLQLMAELEATVFAGIPRELELLAETARQMSINPLEAFPKLRGILVAGELMSPKRKAHLEKLWGRPVYNLYGSTETGNIARMCKFGKLHLSETHYHLEVLNSLLEAEVNLGQIGIGVITTLTKEGTPLLRYVTEDLVSLHESTCACGSLEKEIRHFGRAADCLTIDGIAVNLCDFQEAIYALDPVPIAWKIQEQENGFYAILQFAQPFLDSKEVIEDHFRQYNIPGTIAISLSEPLLDLSVLLDREISTKPIYIEKRK